MPVAYVEAKPNGFIFDAEGSRLEKNLMKPLVKNLSDQHGSYLVKKLSDRHNSRCSLAVCLSSTNDLGMKSGGRLL